MKKFCQGSTRQRFCFGPRSQLLYHQAPPGFPEVCSPIRSFPCSATVSLHDPQNLHGRDIHWSIAVFSSCPCFVMSDFGVQRKKTRSNSTNDKSKYATNSSFRRDLSIECSVLDLTLNSPEFPDYFPFSVVLSDCINLNSQQFYKSRTKFGGRTSSCFEGTFGMTTRIVPILKLFKAKIISKGKCGDLKRFFVNFVYASGPTHRNLWVHFAT